MTKEMAMKLLESTDIYLTEEGRQRLLELIGLKEAEEQNV